MQISTASHRETWQNKKVLRNIYFDFYRRIERNSIVGRTLEIGSGVGNFQFENSEKNSRKISSDIQYLPWLDLVSDAHQMPFRDALFSNIVLVDVLHHLAQIKKFFSEAARVLEPGGRLIMVEPAITPASWPVYKFLHPEPAIMDADPFADAAPGAGRDPFDANQAIPSLLFRKYRSRFEAEFPDFTFTQCHIFSPLSYLLSGGFRSWSLLPARLAPALLAIESATEKFLAPLLGFRMLVVLEKRNRSLS